jgi:hypothetical protein
MELTKEVHNFIDACERVLAAVATNRLLNEDETRIVEHYCKELLAKIKPCVLSSARQSRNQRRPAVRADARVSLRVFTHVASEVVVILTGLLFEQHRVNSATSIIGGSLEAL